MKAAHTAVTLCQRSRLVSSWQPGATSSSSWPICEQSLCHTCIRILTRPSHGFLDNLKAPIELVNHRAEYYKFCITAILEAVGVPTEKLEFVLGSSYQKTPE